MKSWNYNKNLFKIIMLMVIGISIEVKAEVTDITGPELNSYSFSSTNLYSNKSVDITISAMDDISGASYVDFQFYDPTKDYISDINAVLGVQVNIKNGTAKYNSNLINRVNPGTYKLWTVRIYDASMNSTCYLASTASTPVDNCNNTIEGITVTLSDVAGASFSVLDNLTVSKKEISPGESVYLDVTTSDPNITYINITYNDGTLITFNNPNGQTHFSKKINSFTTSGMEYKITQIDILNSFGNRTVYTNDGGIASGAKMVTDFDLSQFNVKVTGERDTENPELNSIKLEKETVYAPGTLKFYVDAVDNLKNNIKQIQIDFIKEGSQNTTFSTTECKGKDNNYVCSVTFDQYTATGTYMIQTIIITDNSNNVATYSLNPIYQKLETIKFNVDTDIKSDVVSSTEDEQIDEKIESLPEDAIITLDSTRNSIVKKSVFDTIKGTNKTLYVESNGVQWIFAGSQITNETKDIDVKVDIYKNKHRKDKKALNSLSSVVINFASNGLLPGIAKIRIKADYTFREFIGLVDLYVYYYDEKNDLFEPVAQKIDMTEDGYYEFFIEHNSTYIISNTKPDSKYISTNTSQLKINTDDSIAEVFDLEITSDNAIEFDNELEETIADDEHKVENSKEKNENNWIYIIITSCIVLIVIIVIVVLKKTKIIKLDNFKKKRKIK